MSETTQGAVISPADLEVRVAELAALHLQEIAISERIADIHREIVASAQARLALEARR